MSKRIGVVLSGCGVRDGSEIHEAVLTLLTIDQAGAEAICMAPDSELAEVNHLTMEATKAKRNVLVESARIARGNIRNISTVTAADLDALVFPGGFGAALNLCDFALKGAACSVNPEVARLVRQVHAAKKPIGAICIAPALIAAILGKETGLTVTIGNDAGTAAEIEKTGAKHQNCPVTEYVLDKENRVVTTPAYMLGQRITEVAEGIGKCVKALIDMA